MTLSQLLSMLWARRRVALGVFLLVVTAVTLVTLVMPRQYVATSTVVIDAKGTDPVTGTALPSQLLASYMATQIDVIGSRNVALKVVDRLKLTENVALRHRFAREGDGGGDFRQWLADALLRYLEVAPSGDSSVVNIVFSASDPKYAAAVANAFADCYIQTSLELKNDPARRQATWFNGQIQTLREHLEDAQQKLANYQQQNNLVSVDPNRIDVENARLTDLNNQLSTAQAAEYDAQSRLAQLKRARTQQSLMQIPDILGNTLLQNMKADLVQAEGNLAEVAQNYGHNHPKYISAAAQVQTLKDKLWAEIRTARGAIEKSAKLAEAQAKELNRAVEQQKATILKLQKQRDQQAVLAREVDNAQQTYTAALQRASQVRMEGEQTQSSIAVLNPATAPLRPTRPNLPMNVLLGVAAGALLGVACALLREMSDRRIRDWQDLAGVIDAPVLAELPPIGRGGHRSTDLVPV